MRKIVCISLLHLLVGATFAQDLQPSADTLLSYFNQLKSATKKNEQLWSKDLYGPLLIINPEAREVYANVQDAQKQLRLENGLYIGELPENIGFANTATEWNGTHWATLLLPLPENRYDRISLMAHELYHVVQPSLGFKTSDPNCDHLDKREGRIYLRLELEALLKAVRATDPAQVNNHISSAILFRQYRYQIYPDAKALENTMELNEGLAEYTGEITCGRGRLERVQHFADRVNEFMQNPTFVRSFAYHTTPMYGWLLSERQPSWTKNISNETQLTSFFTNAFSVDIPMDVKATAQMLAEMYNGKKIQQEETDREELMLELAAKYREKFLEKPHIEISLVKMSITFNPTNPMPLDEAGTVYPTMTVNDVWGKLEVKNGGLMSKNWKRVNLSIPTKVEDSTISGDGWTIRLTDGYELSGDDVNGYIIKKK